VINKREKFMSKKFRFLENVYLLILLLIFIGITLTPYIIDSGFLFLPEEAVEGTAIILLFIAGYFMMLLYRQQAARNTELMAQLETDKSNLESRLEEMFKYIGALNVQIAEMRSMFSDIKKYPESKQDFKYILKFLADKVLSIVPANWVVLRVVDLTNQQTLTEYSAARGETAVLLKHNLDNNGLINKQAPVGQDIFCSEQDNLKIKSFCVIDECAVSREQKMFLKVIANQLEMLYVIFTSLNQA